MIEQIKSLCERLGMPEVYTVLQARWRKFAGEKIRVAYHSAIPLSMGDWDDYEMVPLMGENEVQPDEAAYADCCQGADLCMYAINALGACTKVDMQLLKVLNGMGIPVVVVVVNYEKLAGREECEEVCTYVKWRLREFLYCRLVENPSFAAVSACEREVIQVLAEQVMAETFCRARATYERVFVLCALDALLKRCEEGMAHNELQRGRIDESEQRKYAKLENLNISWGKLELELARQRSALEKKLRLNLDKRKEEILYDIRHDLDTTSDVKLYWEKHLPYKMEKSVRFEMEKLTSLIQADVTNTLRYIETEILRVFKNQQVENMKISFTFEPEQSVVLNPLDVVDTKKFQLVMKLGTAVSVVAAGALLASNPLMGGVMVVSTLAGVFSGHLLGKKMDDARQEALRQLPLVADQFISASVAEVIEQLRVVYEQILDKLKAEQRQWREKSEEEIAGEKRNAEHNLIETKWEICREELMELVEQVKR